MKKITDLLLALLFMCFAFNLHAQFSGRATGAVPLSKLPIEDYRNDSKDYPQLTAFRTAAETAIAESGTAGLLTWTLENGTLTIRGNGAMPDYDSYRPHWYYYRDSISTIVIESGVISIGNSAFSGCSNLAAVTISNSVASIGDYAFYNCGGLSITIPESVTSIGYMALNYTPQADPDGCVYINKVLYAYKGTMPAHTAIAVKEETVSISMGAFANCSGLISVTIPSSVTSIGNYAFNTCNSLTSVTIPQNVTNIGYYAFYGTPWYDNQPNGCVYINKVLYAYKGTMPAHTAIAVKEGTVSISPAAFTNLSNLTSITIPASVTSIGMQAFYSCSGLTSIIIPQGVRSIESSAFYNCYNLASVVISNSVTSIGDWAFCFTNLTSITIPNGVKSIGMGAFGGCGFTSVTIPNSVERMGANPFSGCPNLTEIKVDNTNPFYMSENGVLFNKAKTVLFAFPAKIQGSYTIPNGVTTIEVDAFGECSLTSITIPNTVTNIEAYAFEVCENLTSITIPENVKTVGEDAFYNCIKLSTVNFNAIDCARMESRLYGNGYSVFDGCPLTVLNIGAQVTRIPDYAFSYCCEYITSVNIPISVKSIGNYAFLNWPSYDGDDSVVLTSVTIGNNVENIGDYAFSGCGFTSVSIPKSVKTIGNRTFIGCPNLTTITIPENVTSIGDNAFGKCCKLSTVNFNAINCTSMGNISYAVFAGCPLTTLNIGTQVAKIPACAFASCTELTSVSIPNSVNSIGYFAFAYCPFTSIAIPKSVERIEELPFYSCTNLISIEVESTNLSYASENGVLFNKAKTVLIYCPEGKSGNYIIPNSVDTIRVDAFHDCKSLTSIIIPPTVKVIENNAFYNCKGLTSIICYALTPPSLAYYSLSGVDKEACILYVPAGSVVRYKNAWYWQDFLHIVGIGTGIQEIQTAPLTVFPNPVSETLHIKGLTENALVTVTDISGKIVWQQSLAPDGTIATGRLPNGVYFVNVKGQIIKIIKR